MAAECQRDIRLMKNTTAPMTRVMAQQNLKHSFRQITEGFLQITIVGKWRPTDILHAHHGNGGITTMNQRMIIQEQMPAHPFLHILQHILIAAHIALTLIG